MKRIVTAHDAGGKSVFASDGEPPKGAAMAGGGLEITEVWGTEDVPTLPSAYGDPLNGASIPLFARTNARSDHPVVSTRFEPDGSSKSASR